MPQRSSTSGLKSRMRSFITSMRQCFGANMDIDEDREERPRLRHATTTLLIKLKDQADRMVGEGIGLPRTMDLRKLLANADGLPQHGDNMADAELFKMDDEKIIWKLFGAFEPEFKYLADAVGTTVERGSTTGAGQFGRDKNQLPSELIYGHPCPEVDRTIVGILCMKWLLANDYATFTARQNVHAKLKESEFKTLRTFFIETFGNSSNSYMLIVSMILNDLGKNENLKLDIREAISRANRHSEYNVEQRRLADHFMQVEKGLNHDEVIYYAAKLNVLELITEFDGDRRQQLELGIQFGSMLNLGQLAQAENVPRNLQDVADLMKDNLQAFQFKFLEVVLDVAGAQGHVDSTCSMSWISPVYQGYENSRLCVVEMIKGNVDAHGAFHRILQHRARLLHEKGFKLLSTDLPRERALLRLITMARAANTADAQRIENALDSLPTDRTTPITRDFLNRPIDNLRQAVINGLNVAGIDDGVAIIPYYAPGLLAEIIRVTKAQDELVRRDAVAAFLRLMARAFVGTRPRPDLKKGHVLECDLSFAQQRIRDPEFETNPRLLDTLDRPEDMEIYNKDIEPLMRDCYGIRTLSRRGTSKSVTT